MATHAHRTLTRTERAWTGCVTPAACAASPARQAAHGSVIYLETCRCGAERKVEGNGRRANRSEWHEKNPHAVALGRKGGQAKSAAKTAAVRRNAKLGGRPKKLAE